MTKFEVDKIKSFIKEVSNINDELISYINLQKLNSNDTLNEDKLTIKDNLLLKIKSFNEIKIRIEGFLRAIIGESSTYVSDINKIHFIEDDDIDIDKISNKLWKENKFKLLGILNIIQFEFEEKLRIGSHENSLKSFLKSNQARGIILTAILSLVVGFLSKDYISSFVGKTNWSKLGTAFPNFEVIEFKRTVNLTEWTPTTTDNDDELTGKSTFDDNFLVRKIRSEGNDFCITSASSGSDPKFTSQTHTIDQKPIDIKFIDMPFLKNQVLAILDVSKEKINSSFLANIRSVRYRGFKDEKANWCSVGIWHSTQKLFYRVDFPKGKMGNTFSFSTSFFYNRNNFQRILPDSSHLIIKDNSLTWIVDHPITGNAYRIDWNW